uniref:ATP-dependent RNA helicase n=1 Tax=Lygus hesperus TaxID=30085 RepID=A0A0A9Z2H7_LYGHE
MEPSLARRFTGEEHEDVDRSGNLQKLLKSIEKRKSKNAGKSKKQTVEVDSGVECNTEVEVGDSASTAVGDAPQSVYVENPEIKPFHIIGGHDFEKSKKVVSPLPKWLANPTIISTDLANLSIKVKKFKVLDKLLIQNLKDSGVKYLFPVQAKVIPWMLQKECRENSLIRQSAPRDLCVSAPTGSGKTLTYVLPILHSLKNRFVPRIRALVVVPVQELALQVLDVFKRYSKGTKLKIEVSTGGKTELFAEQMKLVRNISGVGDVFESRIDILVTTPGRLVEHLNYTKGFDLTHLRYLIIDEADRVMENVQDDWMHILEKHINYGSAKQSSIVSVKTLRKRRQPQKLLFSATLSHDPEKLKQLGLFQPILFTSVVNDEESLGSKEDYIGKYTTPQELEEYYTAVPIKLKPLVMWALVNRGWKKILCFAKSVEDAHRLSQLFGLLLAGKTVKELSSKLNRKERDDTLKEFAEGNVDILVCSDVMARGIDIPGVNYVVSYDPPKHVEGYIHRVGRTGRAGASGTALTLLDPDSQKSVFLQKLQQVNKANVEEMLIPDTQYIHKLEDYRKALVSLKTALEVESYVQKKDLKRKKVSKNRRKHKKLKSKP